MNHQTKIVVIICFLITACSSPQAADGLGEKHIVAHPQYEQGDKIDCLNWESGTTLTLEIDDPANGSGVDFSTSAISQPLEISGTAAVFDLGDEWDLQPGHIITVKDKQSSFQHTVRNISVTGTDFEADLITGTADPGSEIMVWIEAPYEHELRVTADANGEWHADFTDITDIIPATIGAIAQNDDPPQGDSHTRVNFTFGSLHLEASLNDDVIGFNNFTPLNTLSFQIYDAVDGISLGEGTRETNEIGYATFDNEDRAIDLQPGTLITAQDHATGREVSMEMGFLSIGTVEKENGVIAGEANNGDAIHVNIYDRASEAEYTQQVTAGQQNTWRMEFDFTFTLDMDIIARVFEEDGDETAYRWIWE